MRELRSYYMKQNQYWMLDRISEFDSDIRTMKKMTPITAIHFLRKDMGYDDFLKEHATERGVSVDDWLEVADEIEQSASGMRTIAEWISFTETYEEQLKAHQETSDRKDNNGIVLMTMHSSKGLEYDVVFIPTVNEGVSPYRKAVVPAEIEEERRMLYVAMTRAKHHLHISYVKNRYNKKADISRFIREIDPDIDKQNKK